MNEEIDLDLLKLRQRIDEIDSDILDLLCERFKCASSVRKIKGNRAKYRGFLFIDPTREADIIRKQIHLSEILDLPRFLIGTMWRSIISATNFYEQDDIQIIAPLDCDPRFYGIIKSFYPSVSDLVLCDSVYDLNSIISDHTILTLDSSNMPRDLIKDLVDQSYYVHHIERLNNGRYILFFGKIISLYTKEDALFILYNSLTEVIKIVDKNDFEKIKYEKDNDFLYLGSSSQPMF